MSSLNLKFRGGGYVRSVRAVIPAHAHGRGAIVLVVGNDGLSPATALGQVLEAGRR